MQIKNMELISLLLAVIIVMLIVCFNEVFKGKYLNKGWADKNLIVEPPTFRIEKVERTIGCNSCWVGKYTAECWYKTKSSVDFTRIIFYDDLNKYNVGDILVLTPEVKEK